jgi:hypothetical protein
VSVDDDLDHAIDIVKHVVVPESQNAIALIVEVGRSDEVGCAVGVLTAVNLDHDSMGVTGEVREVRPDRCLPAYMQ